jgi:indolepyruvate decarboxylase
VPTIHQMTPAQYARAYRPPEALIDPKDERRVHAWAGTVEKAAAEPTATAAAPPGPGSVAAYLNARLAQIGVKHVMAIPGDYISAWVETLDAGAIDHGLVRVHPNNEMCAAYAADGYGRTAGAYGADGRKTVGCAAFTYGVGTLNAVQAVAGAYVEDVPLVVIAGSPSLAQFRSQRDLGVLWHHMFDGSYTDLRIFENVTAMAVRIDNQATAAALIDAALLTCITQSKPVYIEIANLTEALPCAAAPDTPLAPSPVTQNAGSLADAVAAVMRRLRCARRLVLMGGVEIARYGLQRQFVRLAQLLQAPYVSDLLGKSLVSEYRDDVRFSGTYNGRNSQENVAALVREADHVLTLGVRDTDFNFAGLATADYVPDAAASLPPIPTHLAVRLGAVRIGANEEYWGDVDLGAFVAALTAQLEAEPNGALPNAPFPGLASGTPWEIPPPEAYAPGAQVTWDSFKSLLQHDFLARFAEDDAPVVLADTGFSFYGLSNLKVAESGFVGQLAWGAIGYTVAANYGVKLANETTGRKRRAVSVVGDAAFAQTVNALGTIAQLGLDSIVFVMDNRVYAIEQWLIDARAFAKENPAPFAPLCDVPQGHIWDYVKLAEAFGGAGHFVHTNEELRAVLAGLHDVPVNPVTKKPTFTLVAVNVPAADLPSNTAWKIPAS